MKQAFLTALVLLGIVLSGCDSYPQDGYETQYVVQGYLVGLEPLPMIGLGQTVAVDELFDFDEQAVEGATVTVTLLDASGGDVEVYYYTGNPDSAGTYIPRFPEVVRPNRSYRLDIQPAPGAGSISAITTVPDTMSVVAVNGRDFVYQGAKQAQVTLTPSVNPDRQNYFVFSVRSNNPDPDNLVPLYHPSTTPFDEIEPPEVYASPILAEGNYVVNPDGTVTVTLPWLAVVYYGPTTVTTNVLDDAVYDFLRTQAVQQGGSTLSPGEIPNALSNVRGGIGVFGSYSRVSVDINITKR